MRRVYNVHMIWWPLKKLPQVIHVWLSEFPFHEILCLAFYSFLYKKCISCKVTFEVAIFVKKNWCQKWIVISCSSIIFFVLHWWKWKKKAETAYCIILTLFLMNCRSCVQRKKKWNDLNYYYPENVTFLTKKTRFFYYFECCINFLNSFNRDRMFIVRSFLTNILQTHASAQNSSAAEKRTRWIFITFCRN